jgi:hypothetical protein
MNFPFTSCVVNELVKVKGLLASTSITSFMSFGPDSFSGLGIIRVDEVMSSFRFYLRWGLIFLAGWLVFLFGPLDASVYPGVDLLVH